jgi:hypothetical protein
MYPFYTTLFEGSLFNPPFYEVSLFVLSEIGRKHVGKWKSCTPWLLGSDWFFPALYISGFAA